MSTTQQEARAVAGPESVGDQGHHLVSDGQVGKHLSASGCDCCGAVARLSCCHVCVLLLTS